MPDGIIKNDAPTSAADGLSQQIMKLNIFDDDDDNRSDDDEANRSDDENDVEGPTKTAEDEDEEDEIIQGLSNFSVDSPSEHREDEYTSKGPIR